MRRVVRDADLGAELAKQLRALGLPSSPCTSWSAREAAARFAVRAAPRAAGAMPLRRMNAMTTSMRSAECDLGLDLVANARLAGGVREQRRVEQWDQWFWTSSSGRPSGVRPSTARRTVPGSSGASNTTLRSLST